MYYIRNPNLYSKCMRRGKLNIYGQGNTKLDRHRRIWVKQIIVFFGLDFVLTRNTTHVYSSHSFPTEMSCLQTNIVYLTRQETIFKEEIKRKF